MSKNAGTGCGVLFGMIIKQIVNGKTSKTDCNKTGIDKKIERQKTGDRKIDRRQKDGQKQTYEYCIQNYEEKQKDPDFQKQREKESDRQTDRQTESHPLRCNEKNRLRLAGVGGTLER